MKIKVFNKYKLRRDNYSIAAIGNNNLISYYCDSPDKLDSIKEKWNFDKKNIYNLCDSDYQIFVYQNNQQLGILSINFNCKSLTRESSVYEIEENEIRSFFNDDFVPLMTVKKQFNTVQEGRSFWNEQKKTANLWTPESMLPKWIEFDGSFDIIIENQNEKLRKLNDIISFYSKAYSEKIAISFPTEKFELRYSFMMERSGKEKYGFQVNCNKTLFEKYNLSEKFNWQEYKDLKLELFYKKAEANIL